MTTPAADRAPTITDIVARQLLALADQSKAIRGVLDALDSQIASALQVICLLQDVEAQRRAAASARAGADDEGPKLPPVFGRGPNTLAPELPPVPPSFDRS